MKLGTFKKKEFAAFVPYVETEGGYEFFLQKRDHHAKRSPNRIGLFGGGVEEDETVYDALLRETQEELNYAPSAPIFFSRYETANDIMHVYTERVDSDFETKVRVDEGEYGRFYKTKELKNVDEIAHIAGVVVSEIEQSLLS